MHTMSQTGGVYCYNVLEAPAGRICDLQCINTRLFRRTTAFFFFFLSFCLSLSLSFFFFFHRSHSIRGLYLITPTTILQLFYPLFEMSYCQPFIDNVVTRSEDEFQACVDSVTTLQDRPNGHVPEGQPFRYTEFDS